MNFLICLLITVLMFVMWLTESRGWLPREFALIPDVLSIVAAAILLAQVARRERFDLPFKHAIVLLTLLFVMVAGFVINNVSAYTIIAALREYLKYLPFFLLPVVYRFSDQQLRTQLLIILTACFVQVPVALYQRFIRFEGRWTGDLIGGTFGENASGQLAIFLACAIAVVSALWCRGRISYMRMIVITALLIVPCAINLTTISFLTIPFAFIIPIIYGPRGGEKVQRLTAVTILVLAIGAAFIPAYSYFKTLKGGPSLVEFVTSPDLMLRYIYEGSDTQYDEVKRIDAVAFAFRTLKRDDNLILGVGAGNASPSPIDRMRGEYHRRYWRMEPNKVFLSKLTWEMGVVGVSLYLIWMFMIWRSAKRVKDDESIVGVIGLAWLAITPTLAGSFAYFKTFDINIYSYLYFFYSGVIVAHAHRLDALSDAET